MKISCLVVDDVALNRQALLDLAGEVEFLNVAGQCSNAQEALNAISELEPDVIFLDIEMPGMSGLEFLKSLADPPLTVITTSHPEFAVEGYEMQVFDYIVKPVTRERFHKCAERIVRYFKEKRSFQLKRSIHQEKNYPLPDCLLVVQGTLLCAGKPKQQ